MCRNLFRSFIAAMVIPFLVIAIGWGTADAARTIKLAHVVNEKDGFHVAALKFKELVEERTKGEIKIEIYPNASLGDERTLLEGMQIGTIDMGVITNGPVANFYPKIAVFELPFFFGSPEEAYGVLDGAIGQKLLKNLQDIRLAGLAYGERGFRNLTNSKRPVNSPADMKGLKIRVMENPVYIDTFKALGANAVPMAWTECLTALQQGTIDGQENPVNVIYAFKLNQTQKYLSMTRHTYAPALFVMSLKLYNSLTKEVQSAITDAASQAAKHERKWNAEQEQGQLKALADQGMNIISPDLASFKEAVKPVYQKYNERFGDVLAEIQKQMKK